MKIFLFVIIGLVALFFLCLYLGQGQLIYFPRRYYETYREPLGEVDQIHFQVDGKKQISFLHKRGSTDPPEHVWWLFGGNGALALDWLTLVEMVARDRPDTAFVMVDYPGFGFSKGSPHPARIFRSVDRLHEKLAERWNLAPEQLSLRSGALGHSLGAAVALDTANRYDFPQVIAISPFTTMEAMARRQMGGLGGALLSHQYDNEVSLDQMFAKKNGTAVTILHGVEDRLIPISMSKALIARSADSERITFLPVPRASHNNIISTAQSDLVRLLLMEMPKAEAPKKAED